MSGEAAVLLGAGGPLLALALVGAALYLISGAYRVVIWLRGGRPPVDDEDDRPRARISRVFLSVAAALVVGLAVADFLIAWYLGEPIARAGTIGASYGIVATVPIAMAVAAGWMPFVLLVPAWLLHLVPWLVIYALA